ncbi:MAG: protein kinase [Sandaracinaceae bacterium]|nr:protein kinase [Sandaracinaceae bacterium]
MIDVGSKLRDYEIIAHLRVGGMATLFLGKRQGAAGFAKLVAIKVIHPHLAKDQNFVRMFVDEALISARIDHPNVVHVEELGEFDGTKFLVMEYVHGCSLSQLLGTLARDSRRLAPELAVHIAVRVAEGLHAAHETVDDEGNLLNIVHRDVSPQNVLISSRGHVKLIDFGIAKARGRAVQTTSTSLKGKISYMSPEQAYGRSLDRRSDVYALGVVLWEMLTVRRMFSGEDDFALLDMVRAPNVPPPSTYAPEVSPALDAAVMAALAPDVEKRVQSASDFRRMLAEAMPSALTLDAADLSSLLYAVMGAELEAQRASIVGSASGNTPSVSIAPPPRDGSLSGSKSSKSLEVFTVADRRIKAEAAPVAWEPPNSEATVAPVAQATPAVAISKPRPKFDMRWAAAGVGVLCLGVGAGVLVRHMAPIGDPVVTQLANPVGAITSPTRSDSSPTGVAQPAILDAGTSEAIVRSAPEDSAAGAAPVGANAGQTVNDAGPRDAGHHRDGGRRRRDAGPSTGGGTGGGGVNVPIVEW